MKNWRAMLLATTAFTVLVAMSVHGAGPTFHADYRFTGTSLTGFKPLGQADWKVQNGEIVGTPRTPAGGWLFVDGKEFQDLQVFAGVTCAAGCTSGILMRAEKTADGGMKGILMSLNDGDLVPYMVKLDATATPDVTKSAIEYVARLTQAMKKELNPSKDAQSASDTLNSWLAN